MASASPVSGSERGAGLALGALAALAVGVLSAEGAGSRAGAPASDEGCLTCHAGIEAMHPEAGLTCTDCHGGDPAATSRAGAHPRAPDEPGDERVAPLDRDPVWLRFKNPMDLRVVDRTCGTCHADEVARLRTSLHGTTAGHLSDGFYETGIFDSRGSRYSVFPVDGAPREGGEVERLVTVPAFDGRRTELALSAHYGDLPRKECMQCHLYSTGRAVRGRVGFDGDYRGEGCAACHVERALDGLSRSADPTVPKFEPGHPARHEMTRAPTTQTCTTCHYGDASIGLSFRGLSQLPPGAPGGPDIPGTTDVQLNRAFYLDDPAIVPPDVHHERGMHCIDCHTAGDVMGDGMLHGQMEHAVEISCSACHGTFTERSTLTTERGTPLEHLRWEGETLVLTSKVDGARHVVPQAVHVLDPRHDAYNPRAARAMTSAHQGVECHTCHSAWNVNFLGFHFSRNASLTQLDLLAGRRTPGRVTTQEKVFATWKSFYAGLDEGGRVSPYLTGFSTMGSVWDERGELVLDQALPETARGLSGMTMIHHQMHTNRPTARACVECHRTSATWGMGSANFRLGRQLAWVADRRGIEVVAIDRADPPRSAVLQKLVLANVVDLALRCDPVQGHGELLYAAERGRGVHVIDVGDPLAPRHVAFVATVDPRGLELTSDALWVADGAGGLRVFGLDRPDEPRFLAAVAGFETKDVEVRWPWAYVADGPGGLAILDVRDPAAPRLLSTFDLNGGSARPIDAVAVRTLFQYGRPVAHGGRVADRRTGALNLCAVLDRAEGLVLVDVTEPTRPRALSAGAQRSARPLEGVSYRDLVLSSQVDPAEGQGGDRTYERDYAYVLIETTPGGNPRSSSWFFDVSAPEEGVPNRGRVPAGRATSRLVAGDYYSPPFRRRYLFSAGEYGVSVADVTTTREPAALGTFAAIRDATAIALEEFPLDRMLDERGRPTKDVSHAGSRWLDKGEIERILSVPAEALGLDSGAAHESGPGVTARLQLEQLDADRSGMLDPNEAESLALVAKDADGDGRVSLAELARAAGAHELFTEAEADVPPEDQEEIDRDGELACLLDRVDPLAMDDDENGRLDRKEAERAVFAALDLDGDDALDPDELSRLPGPSRALRFGDRAAAALWKDLFGARGRELSRRSFRLADELWRELDADGDGDVRIVASERDYERARGVVVLERSEWPARRRRAYPLPPGSLASDVLRRLDSDGDGALSQKELRERRELLAAFDADRDGTVTRDELDKALGRLRIDDFVDDAVGRWDWNGDGEISVDELPDGLGPGRARLLTGG